MTPPVDLSTAVRAAAQRLWADYPDVRFKTILELEPLLASVEAVPFDAMLRRLLERAARAVRGPRETGLILVRVLRAGSDARVQVIDTISVLEQDYTEPAWRPDLAIRHAGIAGGGATATVDLPMGPSPAGSP